MEGINRFKSEKLKAGIVEISRDEARLMLSVSDQDTLMNYRESPFRDKIDCFVELMANGEWDIFNRPGGIGAFVHDPILITPGGCIYEGKHRMIALSEQDENIKVEFLVVLGFGQEQCAKWGEWRRAQKGEAENGH